MDILTKNIFKAIDAKKSSQQYIDRNGSKKTKRPVLNQRSRYEIMKEKLAASEWKPELPEKGQPFIAKGWRNETLRWLGLAMKDAGIAREIIEPIISKAAKEICIPPFSDYKLSLLVKRIFEMDAVG